MRDFNKILIFLLAQWMFIPFISAQNVAYDTIVKLGGRKIAVNVISISTTDVNFKLMPSGELSRLSRKQIEKILYKSGKVDIFNKPVIEMISEDQWEAVLITEKKEDVEGMYEYGPVKANSSSDTRNVKTAKKNATIRLQKRAANIGANIVLITKTTVIGGYGEIPGYEMEGIAYGFNPPPVTNKDKDSTERK